MSEQQEPLQNQTLPALQDSLPRLWSTLPCIFTWVIMYQGSSTPNTVINQILSEQSYKSVKTPIISSQGNNTTKVLFKLITPIPNCCPNEPSFCPELTKRKTTSSAVITTFPFKLLTGDRCCILRPIDLQLAWLSC